MEYRVIVRSVMSLIEEINSGSASLWIIKLIIRLILLLHLSIYVVKELCLIGFFLSTRRSLPRIVLYEVRSYVILSNIYNRFS